MEQMGKQNLIRNEKKRKILSNLTGLPIAYCMHIGIYLNFVKL